MTTVIFLLWPWPWKQQTDPFAWHSSYDAASWFQICLQKAQPFRKYCKNSLSSFLPSRLIQLHFFDSSLSLRDMYYKQLIRYCNIVVSVFWKVIYMYLWSYYKTKLWIEFSWKYVYALQHLKWTSEVPILLQPNLVCSYIIVPSVLWKNWIAAFKVKVTAKIQNVNQC